jgi:competence protein ComEA
MSGRQEIALTFTLLALCVLLVGANLYPRMLPAPVEIHRQQPEVVVSISGAVAQPGLYEQPWGSRAADLIEAAGGLLADAEETLVNLALPLDHGASIAVPTRYTETGDERISLNSASPRDLESLPGIGPVLAQRIIESRPFYGVDELIKVSGIGPVTLERLRPLVKP